eukprot:TRINITY_DN5055_c0_g1_i1.p1 TRINITY_DN5055_c0_g1~~TRINITY_DN5055_c0_g1_i1.p1  ORF type:complete len:475 (+),score=66.72 TRINITY_DN5055_c0_g1_i1:61-1485(+)
MREVPEIEVCAEQDADTDAEDPRQLRRGLSRRKVVEEMDPKEAMMKLLSHVTLDPDGGILNLSDDADHRDQESKVGAIKKTTFEMFFAFLIVMRVLFNSYHILWVSSIALKGYLLSGHSYHDQVQADFKHLKVSLPFAELILMTHAAELGMLLWFISKASRHALNIAISSSAYERYSHVAKFFWTVLPSMVGLSSLQVLTFVHPALLARMAKDSTKTHKAASRALLLEILKMSGQEHEMADEDLVYEAYHVTNEPTASSEEALVCNNFLVTSTPANAIRALASTSDTLGPSVDQEALRRAWRLELIFYAERALFLAFSAVCAALGTLAFFIKICELAVRLVVPMEATRHEAAWRLIVFLNQVLSIVNLRRLLMIRVQTFIFGGTDVHVSAEETFIMDHYFSRLAQVVLESKILSCLQKWCIMIQLDDEDLQELIVEENWHMKASITRSVKKYMETHGLGYRNHCTDCLIGRQAK